MLHVACLQDRSPKFARRSVRFGPWRGLLATRRSESICKDQNQSHDMVYRSNLIVYSLEVHKTSLFHTLDLGFTYEEWAIKDLASFFVHLVTCLPYRFQVSGSIITANTNVSFDRFYPAPRGTTAVGFCKEMVPIWDGPEEVTDVDKVEEVILSGPRFCSVLYLEADVGRNPFRLAG